MTLKKTPLHSWHESRANMVPFAGFSMPVVYKSPSSISIEHNSVRNHAGIFDVSHMGRMVIRGKDSLKFLNFLVPRDLSKLPINKIAYGFLLNEQGGFKDDITVARLEETEYLLTWNAGNLIKILNWITELSFLFNINNDKDIFIEDISSKTSMIAFQGPKAPFLTEKIFGINFPGSWKSLEVKYKNIPILIMGSGYTGESGCEIVIYNTTVDEPKNSVVIWENLLSEELVQACGLGARDTLRTEAGMCLYGNEITETISPIEAGLAFHPLINNEKGQFIGKQALEKLEKDKPSLLNRIGLIALKKGPAPRQGMKIYKNETEVGFVTSGSFSPLLKIGIGMGYIQRELEEGVEVILKEENSKKEIKVKTSGFPLFDSDIYGSKRKVS